MNNNNNENKASYIDIFFVFFKIGAFTFGGGYGMIPLIQSEVVKNKAWIDENESLDIFAIAQSCPGVIAINTSTFVGNRIRGFWGGLAATIGSVLPSYLTILAVSFFYNQFRSNIWVDFGFRGVRAAVGIVLVQSVYSLYKAAKPNRYLIALIAISFISVVFLDVSTISIIIASALIGASFGAYRMWRSKGESNG